MQRFLLVRHAISSFHVYLLVCTPKTFKQPVGYSVVWHSKALHNWYSCHVIKNTTNQNAGKSLYIRRYYIQPCVGHNDCVGDLTVYSMTWHKIVMQRSVMVYECFSTWTDIPLLTCISSV